MSIMINSTPELIQFYTHPPFFFVNGYHKELCIIGFFMLFCYVMFFIYIWIPLNKVS